MSAGRVLFCRGEEDEADHDDIWDDSELIAAYDRALASARAELGMAGAAAEEKPSKKWRIGDFCRAVYSVDGQWYEAEILSVGGARCRLRYVGYGNEEDQPLGRLQPSAGKKERRRQEREAEDEREAQEEGEEEAESEEEDQGEAEEESRPAERAAGKSRRSAAERGVGSVQNPAAGAQSYTGSGQTRHSYSQQAGYPGAGPIPTYPAGQPTPGYPGWGPPWAPGPGSHGAPWGHRAGPWGAAPPWGARAGYGGRAQDPYLPAYPPPPPPPPVPGDADPVQLANMLMSWYISGYHTGYYQASREARK
ncbi:survival motor neuron protein-like [Amphibalanus amphitrite]|uniref:survival motor neuron protein-like n=1 Tax=Amphibalanus amphitrite TaxID=1232801 RepID=UPI001C917EE9|nr:survival motor neuron protein-like [Amphibalanus amphitrite]XP_043204461.1 survival motor neuron protein-like [Amphibalanus amphitrite]XP_043204462.1 survival motor neuron protein-like [Amphibalanus amphitrite]XP_043204464.1 survival motor neuron protein-like [Amphibalanus amphitrite]